jgi:hypothetical protein
LPAPARLVHASRCARSDPEHANRFPSRLCIRDGPCLRRGAVRRDVQDAQKLDLRQRVHKDACADLPALSPAAERCQASRQFMTMQPCMPALPFFRLTGPRTSHLAPQNTFRKYPAGVPDVTWNSPTALRNSSPYATLRGSCPQPRAHRRPVFRTPPPSSLRTFQALVGVSPAAALALPGHDACHSQGSSGNLVRPCRALYAIPCLTSTHPGCRGPLLRGRARRA